MFSILAAGIFLDFGIRIIIQFNNIDSSSNMFFELLTPGLGTAIIASVVLITLVIVNFILLKRKHKLLDSLYKIISDPAVSDYVKRLILAQISQVSKND
jgi:hypothetical protein